MRKIISKQKQGKRKQMIVGIVLIFVMFGSIFGVIVGSFGKKDGEQKVNYNGFDFVKQSDFWFTGKGNLNFVFKYNPTEVERIDSELKYMEDYYGKPLYIFSEYREAEIEIYRNLDQIAQRIQPACFEQEDDAEKCEENWPVKTCEDNFIIIKESNITKIIQNKSCVFIQGGQGNLTKITDAFLFKMLGIAQ